jgi:hypothetical protein
MKTGQLPLRLRFHLDQVPHADEAQWNGLLASFLKHVAEKDRRDSSSHSHLPKKYWQERLSLYEYCTRSRDSSARLVQSRPIVPVWTCRLVQSLLVLWSWDRPLSYYVVRPPGPGIPIHPHQHDLMNRDERRAGNVRHRRRRQGKQNNSGKESAAGE